MGKFENYMVSTLKRISADKPIDWDLWFLRFDVYMKLIVAGMRPVAARKVMNVYIVLN